MLNPTFLIASTINAEGLVELPAVQGGIPSTLAHALFGPDDMGGFVQQVVPCAAASTVLLNVPRPLDMTFFARCLCCRFGALTPALFSIRGYTATGRLRGRLVHTDPTSESARRRTLQNAFLAHLTAYEERLI